MRKNPQLGGEYQVGRSRGSGYRPGGPGAACQEEEQGRWILRPRCIDQSQRQLETHLYDGYQNDAGPYPEDGQLLPHQSGPIIRYVD